MATLLEAYSKRLAICESVYGKAHEGQKMDNHKKLVIAQMLKNTNNYLTEAFDNSVGVQRADLGAYKKFALNLITVALPNTIASDLVMTYPMTSMTGYVTYLKYTAGSTKGNVTRGNVFNDPFSLKQENNGDGNYTSSKVKKNGTVPTAAGSETTVFVPIRWTPVVPGTVVFACNNVTYFDKAEDFGTANEGKLYTYTVAPEREEIVDRNGNVIIQVVPGTGTGETAASGIKVVYGTTRDDRFDAARIPAGIETTIATLNIQGKAFELNYVYNNTYIPQNDIPLLNAEMDAIPLFAHARRIAVYYSQIAEYQAKQDYGFNLGDKIAEQAVGQLAYEIDTEVINVLDETAGAAKTELTWNRTLPTGVSKQEHYAGFAEIVEIGRQLIYQATKRFAPNWMVIASDILPVLTFIPGFKAAPAGTVNGPYFAGTLNALKVFVSPALAAGRYLLGVNGDDMMSSVAVYAPYMPIVPTQLLQYADGGTSQGFSTLYDIKVLNKDLVIAGTVIGSAHTFVGQSATTPFFNQVVS